MISIGGLVSVGGSSGSGGSSGGSGIQSINSQTGPAILITGVNGISVSAGGNVITINSAALSGLIPSPDGSGINAINGDRGPNIDLIGVNGISVTPLGSGRILIDGIALSGISGGSTSGTTSCYSASFTGILSQTFTHGLGTTNVVIEVYDSFDSVLIPDDISIVDSNNVLISFNRAQTGRIVIIGCGNCCNGGQSGVLGVNGVTVAQIGGNFVVDAAPLSGLITAGSISKFTASFSNITSGQFIHGLNSRDVLVQVYEESPLALQIIPDEIVRDFPNIISLVFNRPQSGRVIVIG